MSRALTFLCLDVVLAAKAVLLVMRSTLVSAFSMETGVSQLESGVFRCCHCFQQLCDVFPPFHPLEKPSEQRAGWVKLANRRGRLATSLHLIRAGGAQRSSCPAGLSGCRR